MRVVSDNNLCPIFKLKPYLEYFPVLNAYQLKLKKCLSQSIGVSEKEYYVVGSTAKSLELPR